MQDEVKSPRPQPFTFSGVASFAHAPLHRCFLIQGCVALLAGMTAACFFEMAWVPVIRQTIAALPSSGRIQDGQLRWPAPGPVRTGTTFLWISIDPNDALDQGEGADLQLDFQRSDLRIRSLLGYVAVPYPQGLLIAMNRTEVEPWWGAWRPAFPVGIAVGTVIGLFVTWTLLALAYAWLRCGSFLFMPIASSWAGGVASERGLFVARGAFPDAGHRRLHAPANQSGAVTGRDRAPLHARLGLRPVRAVLSSAGGCEGIPAFGKPV
ncbi:MAG: hypothetical protein U1G07_10965 [Verrucomicrobiota bacterium]